jgi:hypothetical protein
MEKKIVKTFGRKTGKKREYKGKLSVDGWIL